MKRHWFLAGSLIVLGGLAGLGGCGWSLLRTGSRIYTGQLDQNGPEYKIFKMCTQPWRAADRLESILDNKTYVVLLQNNMELRPTGGFMGSYARVKLTPRGLKEVFVQDIYEPDGQVVGHVEPPYPVQEAFKHGGWWLRDTNWDPDFARAAETVGWFLEQGGEGQVDGIIGVNLLTMTALLERTGPVKLTTYDYEVTAKNLYRLAQEEAELKWEPGSTNKRDFLGAVGAALREKITAEDMLKIAELVRDELDRGQVLVWFKDREIQKEVEKRGWGGRVLRPEDSDYLYIVEANLSANKANALVSRKVEQEVNGSEGKISVTWKNENPLATPRPPVFWGGDYAAYVRVILPAEAEITAVKVGERELRAATEADFATPTPLRQEISWDMYATEERGSLKLVGFWVDAPAGREISAQTTYRMAPGDAILVRRQPGINPMPYRLVKDGKIKYSGDIGRDTSIQTK